MAKVVPNLTWPEARLQIEEAIERYDRITKVKEMWKGDALFPLHPIGDIYAIPARAPEPVEECTPQQIASVARGAADAVDRYGWVQGAFGTEESGFCAMGAINHTMVTLKTVRAGNQYGLGAAVKRAFWEWMREKYDIPEDVTSLPGWNDRVCLDGQELINAFRKFADELDPQQ